MPPPTPIATTAPSKAGAGVNSEFSDQDFKDAGAEVLTDAQAVMNKALRVGSQVEGA